MARTVAVTGATGFVGSHLVPHLDAAGWQVRALVRGYPSAILGSGRILDLVIGSVEDEDSLARLVDGCDAVVHAAGLIKARSAAELFRINADAVGRLARLAAAQPTSPRFVLVSSIAAREPTLSAYAASKRAGESALSSHGAGLPWTVLRPPAIYGPGDRETLPFFRCAALGLAPRIGRRGNRLSLLHVRDLAAALATTLDSGDATLGATFELDDGHPGGYSWDDLAEAAAATMGVRLRPLVIPGSVVRAAAAASSLLARILRRSPMLAIGKARELLHPDWVCHDRAFERCARWRATIALRDGFADTIGWYRSQGWL